MAMIDGKIALSAGSTVPVLELSSVPLEQAVKETKSEPDNVGTVDPETEITVTVKAEPDQTPPPRSQALRTKKQILAEHPTNLPGSLFVGDLRLTSLKSRLAARQIPAEFAGEGVLICGPGLQQEDAKGGSIVAVRRMEEGEIVLEGMVGKVYFDVRRELYAGFAQVAAG